VNEVNRAALQTASLERQDVVGKPFEKAFWWSHSTEIQQRLKNALAECSESEPVRFEATIRQSPSRTAPVEISLSLHGDSITAAVEDISSRVAAKRESDELRGRVAGSETVLRSAHKAVDMAVFDWVVQDNEVAWSPELRRLFGLDGAGEVADWLTLVAPADRDQIEREIRRLMHSRAREYRLEFRVTPAGGARWLRAEGEILTLPDKRQRMLGVAVDLTRHKQLEEAARESEERYRLLMENLPEIVFTARSDGRWDYASPAWTRYTGVAGDQACDYGWSSALHPDDVQGVLYRWMDAVKGARPFSSEHRIRSADGTYRWFLVRCAPARCQEGQVERWFGSATDIDDQKRLELASQSREKWRERAYAASGVGFFELEVDTGRIVASDEWPGICGIQPAPSMHLNDWIDSIHPDDRERVREELRRGCLESGCREFDYRTGEEQTPVHWITTRVTAYVDDEGKPLRVIGAGMDTTERKRQEEVERGKQRLESIGILAGGIAHDFNNLLAGIIGNSSLLLERMSSVGPWIKDILRASDRAADLTRQMLAFAGKGFFQTEPVNLSQFARAAAESVGPTLPDNIRFQLEIAPDLPVIQADPNQARLVLTTLISNAVEAIGESQGLIAIATSVRNVVSESGDVPSGAYICLEVRDTGCGMDEQTRARVFDPFFTTKFQGRGLGLSAALGVVRGHKGFIKVSSTPGQGSVFTVLFPASMDAPAAEPLASAAEQRLEPAMKVLVIDDEDIVRNLARAVLERHGYSVLAAEDGEKGLQQFAVCPEEIALVLLDVSMPGLSSQETLRRLRAMHPAVKVLLFSGYGAAEALRSFEGAGLSGFLQKPFTAQELTDRVNALIGADNAQAGSVPGLHVPASGETAHNHYPA
jgi:PAS domain S-box-containing protein